MKHVTYGWVHVILVMALLATILFNVLAQNEEAHFDFVTFGKPRDAKIAYNGAMWSRTAELQLWLDCSELVALPSAADSTVIASSDVT